MRSCLFQRCSFNRGLWTKPINYVLDLLFGEQLAPDVLLHHTLLVDKDSDGYPEHPELVGHFVVAIHEDRKRIAVLLDELSHFRIIFQLIDREYHKAFITELVEAGLHGRHFELAGLAPGGPEVHEHDLATILAEALGLAIKIIELKVFSLHTDGRDSRAHAPPVEGG